MSARVDDVIEWLQGVKAACPEATVGVDEGGLCLVSPETGGEYELGGLPEDDEEE